ncbi:MAG: ATP-grasp domain-containing protein [Myxococcota bacterium]
MDDRTGAGQGGGGRAIVTYSRGLQSLSVIRSLGRQGVEVIAADEVPVTPGSLSKYATDRFTYPSPLKDRPGFIAALEEAIERFDPGHPDVPYVLMPVHQETSVVAAQASRLAPRIRFALASPDAFDLVQHKGRFHEAAQARGWPTPRTWLFRDADELREAAADLPYPNFVKHPNAVSGIGVHRAESAAELIDAYEQLVVEHALAPEDRPIVQEAVPGEDYAVTALYDHGQARVLLSYRNVLRFPREGGPGAVRETVRAPKLEAMARRVLDEVRWHGIAQVDFRWTGDDEDPAFVIEVNPRFFGGVLQAIESGVDYPWLVYRLAVDDHVEAPQELRYDVRTEKPVAGLLATIEEIAQSDHRMQEVERIWDQAKETFRVGEHGSALRSLLAGLRDSMDMPARLEHARKLLLENEENVSTLFDPDDPWPVLGFIYPVALFLRHGHLSSALLSGAEP